MSVQTEPRGRGRACLHRPDPQQSSVLRQWREGDWRQLVVWGGPGTGKTATVCQALLITNTRLRAEGKIVKLFATTFVETDVLLREKLRTDLLTGVENVTVTSIKTLCRQLSVKYDDYEPQTTLSAVMRALSAHHTDCELVLLCDEVFPCDGRGGADWSLLPAPPRLHCLVALQPRSEGRSARVVTTAVPPTRHTLACQLLVPHRNSAPITAFIKLYLGQYHTDDYLKLPGDAALPAGPRPIWLDCPQFTRQLEILQLVAGLEQMQQCRSVLVVQHQEEAGARAWCEERGWRYCEGSQIYGLECEACVVIDLLYHVETLSRAASLLVVVTTEREWVGGLRPALARGLLDRQQWPGWDGVREEGREEDSSGSEESCEGEQSEEGSVQDDLSDDSSSADIA